MKKTIVSILTGTALMFSIAVLPLATAGAIDVFEGACGNGAEQSSSGSEICGAESEDDFFTIIKNVINLMLIVLGMVAVIMIIIGGIRYTISNGDQSQITSAKNTVLYSVIGLIIAIFSFAIVNFVIDAFGGSEGGGGGGNNNENTIPATNNPGSGTVENP